MKALLSIAFVLLVVLPIFLWQLSAGGEERAPLAIASVLSAIAAMWIIRDDATGQRLVSVFGLAGFFFFVALMTDIRPVPQPYVGVTLYEKTDYVDQEYGGHVEYEEPHGHEDLELSGLDDDHLTPSTVELEEPVATENEDPFDYFRGIPPAETELENQLDSKY